jgi:hypothetical protein
MGSLPRFVILAILVVPARLLGQVVETTEQTPANPHAPAAQRSAATAAHQDYEAGKSADGPVEHQTHDFGFKCLDGCDCWQHSWAHIVRINDTPEGGPPRQAVFVFGGLFTTGSMGDTLDIFNVTYDQNYIIALGYQRYLWSTGRFHWGWEIGTAGRYNDGHSVEFWGGPTVRHNGITLFDLVRLSASATAGFSIVTDTMGHEDNRERARKGDGTFLYYLGPEFAASLPSHPNIELFYRLHHRCGGGGTLGEMREGYNANVVGLRWRF